MAGSFYEEASGGGGGGGGNTNSYGTYALAPATPTTDGDTYQSSDGPVKLLGVSGAWQALIGTIPVTLPTLGDFTQGGGVAINATTGVIECTTEGWLTLPHVSGDVHTIAYIKNFALSGTASTQLHYGFGSATDQGVVWFAPEDQTNQLRVISWTNWKTETGPGFPYTATNNASIMGYAGMNFLRIEDDGVDIIFSEGVSPFSFNEVYRQTRTTSLTGGPTVVAFHIEPGSFLTHYEKT